MFTVSETGHALAVPKSIITPECLNLQHKDIGQHVAFPFSDQVIITLSKLLSRTDLPTPFRSHYKWPGNFTPMAHQISAAEHMVYRRNALCWADIGTGKTYLTIGAMDYVMRNHGVKKVLILCPKSTLRAVWQREIFAHITQRRTVVIYGSAAKKKELLASDFEVCVMNHDAIRNLKEEVSSIDWDLIIVDEHTAFKNWTAARTKVIRAMVKSDKVRLWQLSGEPMPQGPMDMYSPGKMACPDTFPRSKGRYRDMVETQITEFKWIPKEDCVDTIHKMLGNSVFRVSRDECLDLPPTTYETIDVDPSPEQKRIEKQLKKEAVAEVQDGVIVAANEGVHMMRLLQCAAGSVEKVLDDDSKEYVALECKNKLDALDNVLETTTGPVIIFSPWTGALNMLQAHLEEKGIDHHTVSGKTSDGARLKAFDAIQDGTTKVLLANPRTMAHGITLTTSNTIVWWGLPYSNEVYGQANGRITRKGQARNTYIVHLVTMDVERKVYAALRGHSKLQGLLLDLV